MDKEILEILKSMQNQMNNMQNQMNNMQGQIGDVQGQIGDMQGQIGHMQGQIGGMQGQIGDMQNDIKDLKEGQKDIKVKLDGFQNEYSRTMQDLSDKVDVVKTDVKEINDGLNIVETVTSKNWNDIAKLKAVK